MIDQIKMMIRAAVQPTRQLSSNSWGVRFAGKALGRPPKRTCDNAEQLKADKQRRQEECRQRIPIEDKFGQGKRGYCLNYIRAKQSDTSISWVNAIFFVMNLLVKTASPMERLNHGSNRR